MILPLMFIAALATTPEACTEVRGWEDGRAGSAARAACTEAPYREAHRLGDALRALKQEHAQLVRAQATMDAGAKLASARRQRQIEVDLEAIRGVATIKHWPLDVPVPVMP